MAAEVPEPGDKASWSWSGSAPSGIVSEKKDSGTVSVTSKRGNEISKSAKPDDPAIALSRSGNDVVKNQSELDVEEKGAKPELRQENGVQEEKADDAGEGTSGPKEDAVGGEKIAKDEKNPGSGDKKRTADAADLNSVGPSSSNNADADAQPAKKRGRGPGKKTTNATTTNATTTNSATTEKPAPAEKKQKEKEKKKDTKENAKSKANATTNAATTTTTANATPSKEKADVGANVKAVGGAKPRGRPKGTGGGAKKTDKKEKPKAEPTGIGKRTRSGGK